MTVAEEKELSDFVAYPSLAPDFFVDYWSLCLTGELDESVEYEVRKRSLGGGWSCRWVEW